MRLAHVSACPSGHTLAERGGVLQGGYLLAWSSVEGVSDATPSQGHATLRDGCEALPSHRTHWPSRRIGGDPGRQRWVCPRERDGPGSTPSSEGPRSRCTPPQPAGLSETISR